MPMRVTNQTMMASARRNLQTNMARLAQLQDQSSSQKKITRPSDDPAAAAEALRVRGQQRANAQYSRNMTNGDGWLTAADTALGTTTDILNKLKDLALQGANDSLNPAGRTAIATEMESLKTDLFKQANTTYMGRSVFAGNSDAKEVFAAAAVPGSTPPVTAYSYTGTDAGTGPDGGVQRRIDAGTTVRVDVDGAAVFGSDGADGAGSVFSLIDSMVSDLKANKNISGSLAAVDARATTVITAHAEMGTRHAQLGRAQETNMNDSVSLETQRSGIEDVDLGQVILELKTQEVAYQSALAVTARVLQPTLLDFLR